MDRGRIKFLNPEVVSKSVKEGTYPGGSLTDLSNTLNYLKYIKVPHILSLGKAIFQNFHLQMFLK